MGVLCIVSAEEAAGKTAICAGLAGALMAEGKKVGYLRPDSSDGDIAFMKRVLGLEAGADMSNGRDVVLVEGRLGPTAADALSQDAYSAAREMKARVIAVETYRGGSRYAEVYKDFGDSLLGVVVNKVPQSRFKTFKEEASARLGEAGIKLLGVIPEDRALLALTVAELAETIGGKVLNNADKTSELVENYMLGALIVDSGLGYFGRKSNKAAIIRQDRPDMQLAALETSTRCLVLSGGGEKPMYNVMQKAESRGIPIVSTEATADRIIADIEQALSKSRLDQDRKLKGITGIIQKNLDVKALV